MKPWIEKSNSANVLSFNAFECAAICCLCNSNAIICCGVFIISWIWQTGYCDFVNFGFIFLFLLTLCLFLSNPVLNKQENSFNISLEPIFKICVYAKASFHLGFLMCRVLPSSTGGIGVASASTKSLHD